MEKVEKGNVQRENKRCGICGYVIRGANHKEGDHHKMGENGHRRQKKN